jgi:CBS domain-containing protein
MHRRDRSADPAAVQQLRSNVRTAQTLRVAGRAQREALPQSVFRRQWNVSCSCSHRRAAMIVEQIMSRDPYTASVTVNVRHALHVLAEQDVRHLPIVEGQMLVGIVSDRDLRTVIPSALGGFERPDEARAVLSQPIASVMNADVLFVHPESDLTEAIDLMIEHKIGALPVVEPDSLKLIGIVSYVDVLRAARDLL